MKCHLLVGKRHGNLVAGHIFASAVPARGRDCLVDLHTEKTPNNQAGLPLTGRPLLLAETKRFRTTLFLSIDALFLSPCPLSHSRSPSLSLFLFSIAIFLDPPSQCSDFFLFFLFSRISNNLIHCIFNSPYFIPYLDLTRSSWKILYAYMYVYRVGHKFTSD